MLAFARYCTLVLCLVISSQTLAANSSIDTVVMQTGRRWFYGSSKFLANEISTTLFYEISGIPLAMGGGLSFFDIRKRGLDVLDHQIRVEGAWGYEVSLEAKLWIPGLMLTLPFIPYLIYAHDLFSDYEIKGRNPIGSTKSEASTNGYKFSFGIDMPMNSSLTMNMEYSLGSQSIKYKYNRSYYIETDDSVKAQGSVEGSLESQALLLGLGLSV